MDWNTIIPSIFSSAVIAALVTGILNRMTKIQAIKQAGLYAKRAEAIDSLINQFVDLDLAFKRHHILGHGDLENIGKIWERFADTVERVQHYIPEKTAKKLISIKNSYIKILTIKSAYADNPTEGLKEVQDALEDIEPSILKIRGEFRGLLGVHTIIHI